VLAKAGLREVRAVAEHRAQADYYRRVGFRVMGHTWVWTVRRADTSVRRHREDR